MGRVLEAKIIVLFEDEVRMAAHALKALGELAKQRDDSEAFAERYKDALETALQACWAALYHAADEGADQVHLTLAAKSLFKRPKR